MSCPAFVINPKTLPVSDVSTPNFVIMESTESIELFRSVPLISANSINCCDRSPNASPVSPKRVLTSPIAVPAASASVGIFAKTRSICSVSPSSASPVAPVLVMIVSYPLSRSFAAATDATPTPVIAAVTGANAFPADCIPSPTFVIFSPAFDSLSPASETAAPTFSNAVFSFSSCDSRFRSSASVFATSL